MPCGGLGALDVFRDIVTSGFLPVSGVQVLVVSDVQPALIVPQDGAERALREGLSRPAGSGRTAFQS